MADKETIKGAELEEIQSNQSAMEDAQVEKEKARRVLEETDEWKAYKAAEEKADKATRCHKLFLSYVQEHYDLDPATDALSREGVIRRGVKDGASAQDRQRQRMARRAAGRQRNFMEG